MINDNKSDIGVEDVSTIDFHLKRSESAHVYLMSIDRLFFTSAEVGVVKKLKESGQILAGAKQDISEELRKVWIEALGKQLRLSVDRAKKSTGKQ
jgi:hypothetical protein